MSLLTPLYLLGIAAAALPIAFHFLRRTPSGKVAFSSLMFLKPSPPRMTRRSRLQHLPLLLLRVLALCLLAAAFARPFLRDLSALESDQHRFDRVLVLIDASASMKREDLWEQAKAKLAGVLDELGPADQLAVWTFDDAAHEILSFSEWAAQGKQVASQLVQQRVVELSPTWRPTRFDAVLIAASDEVDRIESQNQSSARAERRRIVLISDMQAGGSLQALQGYSWPDEVRLTIAPVQTKSRTNASMRLLSDLAADEPDAEGVRVLVSNTADATSEQFRLAWVGDAANATDPVQVYVPPGQSRTVRVPLPKSNAGDHRLSLLGDDHPFDNILYVQAPSPVQERVLVLGEGEADDPAFARYYLQRAFPKTSHRVVQVEAGDGGELLLQDDVRIALAIVTHPQPSQLAGLRSFFEAGGKALIVAASVEAESWLQQLTGSEKVRVVEASVDGYAMLGAIDFQHPLFAPFSDPRFNDFTKIHFWKYRRITTDGLENAAVLARFDTLDPALVEFTVGEGRALLLASGWSPDDSQLALSSKFVPLMNRMLDWSREATGQTQYFVGGSIPCQGGRANQPVQVQTPDGKTAVCPPGESFHQTDQVGFYRMGDAGDPRTVAVNLAPSESDTLPLEIEQLESLGVRLEHAPTGTGTSENNVDRRQLLSTELESKQKLWRWFVAAALLVLAWESWLANRWSPRQDGEGEQDGPST